MKFLVFTLFLVLNATALEVTSERGVFLIKGVPHVLQKPDFCGEACVEMFFQASGQKISQDDVFDASGLAAELGRGCYAPDLHKALKKLGFDPGTGWYVVRAFKHKEELRKLWDMVFYKLKLGIPTILCTRYSDKPGSSEHFRLIVGFDRLKREVIYHEPAVKDSPYQRMPLEKFLEIWPLKYRKDQWTVIAFFLDQKEKPRIAKETSFSRADYAQHIMKLKEKLPKGFSFVIQKPFVVIGNSHKNVVKKWADGVVKWTVEKIKKQYFDKDPEHILDVWLFKDKQSYEFYNRKLFGDDPGTPYGYYSSVDRSLVMNISTGGGTLVHEIVHPYMEVNFPECPSWFNEGLASLYEQSADKNGRIVGLTNWRLQGLKKVIRAKKLPSFRSLCSTTSNQFYNSSRGDNYAQARYLCYYLQEKGLLEKYYKSFKAVVKTDPSGYETLKKTLGLEDLKPFQDMWEKWVMTLSL